MNIFDQANKLEILTVLDVFNIGYKKVSGQPHQYVLLKDDGREDNSFQVNTAKNIAVDFGGNNVKGGPFDLIGRLVLDQDTSTTVGRATTIKAFIDKGLVEAPDSKPFTKSLKKDELLEKFNDYRLNGYKDCISAWLVTRGVPYDYIQRNQNKIGEIFRDIGYYENFYCSEGKDDEPKQVPVFMFPCYDQSANLIGMKLRRKDGKTLWGKKSFAVGKTGLLYDAIDTTTALIVEGETDFIIMKILGFPSVVGNLGGVQSGRQMLKSLLAETSKVICLYDNDTAGNNGKLALSESFGRKIYEIEYPVREDKDGNRLSDVNDFYEAGYDTQEKWIKIFKEASVVGLTKVEKEMSRFVQLDSRLEYYDTRYKTIQQTAKVASFYGKSATQLQQDVIDGKIPTYIDLCYRWNAPEGYYNTLDKETIIVSGGDAPAVIHDDIKYLINNLSGNNKKNAEWIHQAILYKITHIDDVHVPALILYGPGGSGKGTFLNLLSSIFGKENTQVGLGQKDLEGSFDSYQGEKLIVEFKEVSGHNKKDDKKTLDRIKSFVGEPRISINPKHQNVREVDNLAWVIMSSNHQVPIQLDSKHSGNRRFTIIKTGNSLDLDRAEYINHTLLKDKEVIKSYVNWLFETYPDVPDMKRMSALDNEEKHNLEENCEGAANQFFEWVEEKWPHIRKMFLTHRQKLLDKYCAEVGENPDDIKFKGTNFDNGLSHRYEKKKVRIGDISRAGYVINKTKFELENMPEGKLDYPTTAELGTIELLGENDPFR